MNAAPGLHVLRSKFSTLDKLPRGQHTKYLPKAFTDIETFAKIREMAVNLADVMVQTDEAKRLDLVKRSGAIISELLNDNMQVSDTETTIEVNFAMLKLKHTVKRKKN